MPGFIIVDSSSTCDSIRVSSLSHLSVAGEPIRPRREAGARWRGSLGNGALYLNQTKPNPPECSTVGIRIPTFYFTSPVQYTVALELYSYRTVPVQYLYEYEVHVPYRYCTVQVGKGYINFYSFPASFVRSISRRRVGAGLGPRVNQHVPEADWLASRSHGSRRAR